MKRILFQGDSITDSSRNRNDDRSMGLGYTHLVAGALGFDRIGEYEFYNRGVSGDGARPRKSGKNSTNK